MSHNADMMQSTEELISRAESAGLAYVDGVGVGRLKCLLRSAQRSTTRLGRLWRRHNRTKNALHALEARLKETEGQNIFERAFADKIQEFGTMDRFLEEYSRMKMEYRDMTNRVKTLETRLRESTEKVGDLQDEVSDVQIQLHTVEVRLRENEEKLKACITETERWLDYYANGGSAYPAIPLRAILDALKGK